MDSEREEEMTDGSVMTKEDWWALPIEERFRLEADWVKRELNGENPKPLPASAVNWEAAFSALSKMRRQKEEAEGVGRIVIIRSPRKSR